MSKKVKCYVCGGNYDEKYLETPCPSCGRTYGKRDLKKLKEEPKFVEKANFITIPEHYIGLRWNKEVLTKHKSSESNNRSYQNFIGQLDKIQSIFDSGRLPDKSGVIIARAGYSKVTWAYSCMQIALSYGYTVAPMLDTIELKRLLLFASEQPKYKLYDKIKYDDYIMSDVCFITVTKTEFCLDAWRAVLEILDRRSRKGLATFIISRFDLNTISKWDFDKQFTAFIDYNGVGDSKKYPAIINYTTFV